MAAEMQKRGDMKKVRWGIISTANIGMVKVIPAMQRGSVLGGHGHLLARSRQGRGGRPVAGDSQGLRIVRGAPRRSGHRRHLQPDTEPPARAVVDSRHSAGKHVLVKSPSRSMRPRQLALQREAARHPQVKVMEAFMYRFHPQWVRAKALVDEGQIGELRTIQTLLLVLRRRSGNVRNQKDIGGGGGLMDIGCYPISLSRWIWGAEPSRVVGTVEVHPAFGVDVLASALMDFGGGTATFSVGTLITPFQRVTILGTEGYVEIEIPFNALPNGPHRIWHKRGSSVTTYDVGNHDQYTTQGDVFSRAILDDTPVLRRSTTRWEICG